MESSAPSDCEAIKFLNVEGITGSKIHRKLSNVYGAPHPRLKLNCDLGGRHLVMEKDLQSAVAEFFSKQDAQWKSDGIHKLILDYNNCLAGKVDYVEK